MAWADIWGAVNSGAQSMGGWGNVLQGAYGIYGASRDKKQGKRAANQAAQAATPVAYGTGSMYGSTTVDPRTRQLGFSMAQNPFAQLMNVGGLQSLANAFSAPGSAYGGAAPEIAAAAQGLTGPGLEQEASGRLGILRQLAAPEEQRASNQLTDRLFASGRLGGTGGGIEQEAMARAQSAADLQRQLASQDWAATRAQNRFQGALQAVNAGQSGAINQFNMGQQSLGSLGDMFRLLLAQGNAGIGAATGTPASIAALQYGANTAPGGMGAGMEWLKQSGVFNKIGDWFGGKLPGGTPTAPPTASPVGPYQGGYQFPTTLPGQTPPYAPGP
jgi:hypothetical protein